MAELEEMKAQFEVEEQNKEIAHKAFKALDAGNVEAFKELWSPDFVHHNRRGETSSLEQMIEAYKKGLITFPAGTTIAEDIIAEGDKVVVRYVLRTIYKGYTEKSADTGNEIEMNGINIFRIENGRIFEDWHSPDRLSFYQQLGMELKPKEGK
ncbi:MAG: ester cyclase [Candidatus Aminicenantes bacterium]|nr:ester cyclase [Candidatus Aminicenantes bacterium]